MKKYQVLKGSFSDVYFGNKSKGNWVNIGMLKYWWMWFWGYEVKISKNI